MSLPPRPPSATAGVPVRRSIQIPSRPSSSTTIRRVLNRDPDTPLTSNAVSNTDPTLGYQPATSTSLAAAATSQQQHPRRKSSIVTGNNTASHDSFSLDDSKSSGFSIDDDGVKNDEAAVVNNNISNNSSASPMLERKPLPTPPLHHRASAGPGIVSRVAADAEAANDDDQQKKKPIIATRRSSRDHHQQHQQPSYYSGFALPSAADHKRQFVALETSARSRICASEDDARGVMLQWFAAQRYHDRERQYIKMRVPAQMMTMIQQQADENERKQQQEQEQQPAAAEKTQSSSSNVPTGTDDTERLEYHTYTERSGRLWGTRPRRENKSITTSAATATARAEQQQQQEEEAQRSFEQKLMYSKNAGAFELEALREEEERRKRRKSEIAAEREEQLRLARIASPRSTLEEEERIERAVFVATIFLPEMLRCVEDAERIARDTTEEQSESALSATSAQYHDESKPLTLKWRQREHAALTLQCAFRKQQRNSFGWHTTHRLIGNEIEWMRRKKARQEEKEREQQHHQEEEEGNDGDAGQQDQSSTNKKPSITAASIRHRHHQQRQKQHQQHKSNSTRNAIAELEAEGIRMRQEREEAEIKEFMAGVRKRREDIEFEANWCLQRELQYMSSTFFDNVTKPAMLRVGREEDAARSALLDVEFAQEDEHLQSSFSEQRDHIQRKNDLERRDEALQRSVIDVDYDNGIAKLTADASADLKDTIGRVRSRFASERAALEDAESSARAAISADKTAAVMDAFAWHCSVVDDSMLLFEASEREYLCDTFRNERAAMLTAGTAGTIMEAFQREWEAAVAAVVLEGMLDATRIVLEPLWRDTHTIDERTDRHYMMEALKPKVAVIADGAEQRVVAAGKIQRGWRRYKAGELGRTGRLKYYDRVFAAKKRAAARRRVESLVQQTQKDLENALKAANIHILAGFSQKLQLLQKKEARERQDMETDDDLMRRIFDANMVSAIAATCVTETTVLSRFEAYHRFQIMQEERDRYSKYVTFMELVFVKDVKIRPAQRAVRCHQARNERRRRISEAIQDTQRAQEQRRNALHMEQLSSIAELFCGKIVYALHRVSFASATFVWVQEQERAARECIVSEMLTAARGHLGWSASLGRERIEEEEQHEYRNEIMAQWRRQMFFMDMLSLEVSQRRTVVSMQSENATKNLLSHVESMQRMFFAMAAESASVKLAGAALELNEFTRRTAIEREAIKVGYSVLLHKQEASQRSILQKHLLSLSNLNSTIFQQESDARDELLRQWKGGNAACLAAFEQDARYTLMQEEYRVRERMRFVASEADWRHDVIVSRRYELLMLVELAEQSRRKSLLGHEMQILEGIVDFNRFAIQKKGMLFDSDFCHGVLAILEAQQAEQRRFLAQDEHDSAMHLYGQVHLAERLSFEQKQSLVRAEILEFEQAKWDHLLRYHTRLIRNENYRSADVVWRNCATRVIVARGCVDVPAITGEVLTVLYRQLMQTWRKAHATELAVMHQQLFAAIVTGSLCRKVDNGIRIMRDRLARDPFFQTMILVYERKQTGNTVWGEQAGELARTVLSSDHWLLPNYESRNHLAERSSVADVLEPSARGAIELQEASSARRKLVAEEWYVRNVLLIVEGERAGRSSVHDNERADWHATSVEYQDTILKPLETLRNERTLRASIVEEEQAGRVGDLEKQFAEELRAATGPQRAWNLLRYRKQLLVNDPKREQTFIEAQERALQRRRDLDNVEDVKERRARAVASMQKWVRRRLWSSRATRDDPEIANALATSDALHREAFSGIDIRDRFERVSYCALLVQKVFRGHRSRKPLSKRLAATEALRDARLRQQKNEHAEEEMEKKQKEEQKEPEKKLTPPRPSQQNDDAATSQQQRGISRAKSSEDATATNESFSVEDEL